jgi:hypothetical protein
MLSPNIVCFVKELANSRCDALKSHGTVGRSAHLQDKPAVVILALSFHS